MKLEHDGEWTKFVDEEGKFLDLGLYFEKRDNFYLVGLDSYYHNNMSFEELKLFSEFLSDYVKNEENNS